MRPDDGFEQHRFRPEMVVHQRVGNAGVLRDIAQTAPAKSQASKCARGGFEDGRPAVGLVDA